MGKGVKRRTIYLVNLVLLTIPLAYFTYQPLLRYSTHLIVVDEQPKKVDAIVVLAGGEPGRAWEAADLYNANFASNIVLTKDVPTRETEELRKRGIEIVDGQGNSLRVLRGMGVPEQNIITLDGYVEDTFDELRRIAKLCQERKWRSLIIVTSNYHTRRARSTARYTLRDVEVVTVGAKHGGFNRDAWWKSSADVRTFLIEFEKLVAYTLYFGPRMLSSGR